MKLKIIEVKKDYPVYAPEGKSYKVYSKWCNCELDEHPVSAKIKTFTENIKVEVGAVYETGKDVSEIKVEEKTYNDKQYKEITLKAVKKEFNKPAASTWKPKIKIPMEQYETLVNKSYAMATTLAGNDNKDQIWNYFAAILKGMVDNVEPGVSGSEIPNNSMADAVAKVFGGDDDIPF